MRLREVWIGLAVLLASCASFGPHSTDAPERAQVQDETVHVVGEDLEDAPPASPERPRKALLPSVGEEQRTIGQDPRRIAEASNASPRSAPSAAANPSGIPAWMPNNEGVMAPMAGRVGIMSLLGNELRHVHAGTTPLGNHAQDYNVQYDFNGFVVEELRKSLLTRTPYQPVMVASTATLRRAASTWQDSWDGEHFAPDFQREFDGIIRQNRLDMLIVVSYPEISDGQFITGQKLSGAGLYTRSFLGSTKSAVFCTLQFYRLVGTPAKLVKPIAADDDRSIGDLPNAQLPDDLDNLPARYLVPVYEPLRIMVRNKIAGLIALPRKIGN